jgi:serine/threonine protein kinase
VPGRSSWAFTEGEEIAPGRHAVRLLGGGTRYEAYLAWDDALHSLVVVKAVRPELVGSADALAGLQLEARALEALAHPFVVRAFDAVLDGPRPHLVLEHLDGPRLSTLLRRYGLAVEQVLPLGLQLCSAVHYLGGRGFVHLDVKPRNVIMGAPPRLIDLSVARTVAEARAVDGFVGTDAYMSPEQCDPSRFGEIGPPADVWGLGVTLYEALARRRPFADGAGPRPEPLEERFPQLTAAAPPLPASVPDEIAAAVMACLEAVPERRPAASELAARLEPVAASLPPPRLGRFRPGWKEQLRRSR